MANQDTSKNDPQYQGDDLGKACQVLPGQTPDRDGSRDSQADRQ